MRLPILLASFAAVAPACSAAGACDGIARECLPRAVVFPVYTSEGLRIGTIASPVRRPPALELSPYTGQPVTVVYNDPGRLPGSVDPGVSLVPLPRAEPFRTKAVYPRGY